MSIGRKRLLNGARMLVTCSLALLFLSGCRFLPDRDKEKSAQPSATVPLEVITLAPVRVTATPSTRPISTTDPTQTPAPDLEDIFYAIDSPYPDPKQERIHLLHSEPEQQILYIAMAGSDIPFAFTDEAGEAQELRDKFREEVETARKNLLSTLPSTVLRPKLVYFIITSVNGQRAWGVVAMDYNGNYWLPMLEMADGSEKPVLSLNPLQDQKAPDVAEVGVEIAQLPEGFGPSAKLAMAGSESGWPVLAVSITDDAGTERVAAWLDYSSDRWVPETGFVQEGLTDKETDVSNLVWEQREGAWLGYDGVIYRALIKDGLVLPIDEVFVDESGLVQVLDLGTGEWYPEAEILAGSQYELRTNSDNTGVELLVEGAPVVELQRFQGQLGEIDPWDPRRRMYYLNSQVGPDEWKFLPFDYGYINTDTEGLPTYITFLPESYEGYIREDILTGVLDGYSIIDLQDAEGNDIFYGNGDRVKALDLQLVFPDESSEEIDSLTVRIVLWPVPGLGDVSYAVRHVHNGFKTVEDQSGEEVRFEVNYVSDEVRRVEYPTHRLNSSSELGGKEYPSLISVLDENIGDQVLVFVGKPQDGVASDITYVLDADREVIKEFYEDKKDFLYEPEVWYESRKQYVDFQERLILSNFEDLQVFHAGRLDELEGKVIVPFVHRLFMH